MRSSSRLSVILALLLVVGAVALFGWYLFRDQAAKTPVAFAQVAVERLPEWQGDDLSEFRRALDISCASWPRRTNPLGPALAKACAALPTGTDADLKAHLADNWTAWRIEPDREPGKLTGYFAPVYRGSRTPSADYPVPLFKLPDDLVTARLSDFNTKHRGTIAGAVKKQRLVPYHDRKAIREGALDGRDLELIWLADPVDAFFLQIQGSGQITLPDGTTAYIGYAGQNGHPYRAIGRDLIQRGHLPRHGVSMQKIRGWMAANPDKADEIMDLNPSYVFFTERKKPGAIGAEGVVLTPERSIAVDRRTWYFGLPFWIVGGPEKGRLMMGQDTGGAIRGAVRADYFAGYGQKAGEKAGRMNFPLAMWLLLPKGVTPETALRR
jgi:membrane-bound lytic murein transglycosylase A